MAPYTRGPKCAGGQVLRAVTSPDTVCFCARPSARRDGNVALRNVVRQLPKGEPKCGRIWATTTSGGLPILAEVGLPPKREMEGHKAAEVDCPKRDRWTAKGCKVDGPKRAKWGTKPADVDADRGRRWQPNCAHIVDGSGRATWREVDLNVGPGGQGLWANVEAQVDG